MPSQPIDRRTACAFLLAAGLAPVHAQAPWPTRPITLVVHYGPGGSTDLTARQIGRKLAVELGQPVIIDNRVGAGGSVAAGFVARAAPDGYTLLTSGGSHAINAKLFKNLPYDLVKDFTGVGQIIKQPYVLVVNKDLPARNLVELVALIRQDPGKLNYASAGVGSSNHMAGALLNDLAGGRMVHVAYGGAAPAMKALMANEVQMFIGVVLDVLPHIKSGAVKPIAVATHSRFPILPDLPAIVEVLPGYEDIGSWTGLLAPAGTPAPVIARLNAALNKALADPELQAAMTNQGAQVTPSTPEAYTQFVAGEVAKAGRLVAVSGVTPQ